MSDDLVKRLRDHIAVTFDDRGHVFEDETLCDDAADRIEQLEAELRKAFGDMEQIYRRWKNGVRYDVLAKEQGVTRERMRHRLLRYEDDKVRQLEAELAEARMQALSELGQAQEAYEAQKKAEAERDAAYKRGLEDAAEILALHDSVPCEPNEAWSDEVKNAYVSAQIDAALSWQYAIRVKTQKREMMSDAPKEIWVLRTAEGKAFVYDTAGDAPDDLRDDVKYIRADECKAREDAAHKRGLEDAAKIAQTYSSSRHLAHDMKCGTFPRRTKVSEYLAAAIRAKIPEDKSS